MDVSEAWPAGGCVAPEDLSDLMFTSGTTGPEGRDDDPRARACAHSRPGRRSSDLREGDRYLVVNPFFHTFGYKAGILACLMHGATLVPVDIFDVDKVLEMVEAEQHLGDSWPTDPLPVDPRRTLAATDRPHRPFVTAARRHRGGGRPGRAREAHGCGARIRDGAHRLRPHGVDGRGDDVQACGHPRDDRRRPPDERSRDSRCSSSTRNGNEMPHEEPG